MTYGGTAGGGAARRPFAPRSAARLLPRLRLRRSQPPRSASTAAAHRQGGGAGSARARTPEKADTRPRSASRAMLGALRARRVHRQSGAERANDSRERARDLQVSCQRSGRPSWRYTVSCRQPGRPRPLRQCFFAMGADNASTVSGSQMGGAYPREAWHTSWAPTAARQPVVVAKRSAKRLSFSTQRVTT